MNKIKNMTSEDLDKLSKIASISLDRLKQIKEGDKPTVIETILINTHL